MEELEAGELGTEREELVALKQQVSPFHVAREPVAPLQHRPAFAGGQAVPAQLLHCSKSKHIFLLY